MSMFLFYFFFFQAEDGIRDKLVTGVQTCALPIFNARGGAWNRDGVIIYCPLPPSPLFRIPASGGDSTPLNSDLLPEGGMTRWLPSFLPDGRHYLYVARMAGSEREVRIGSLDSNDSKTLITAANSNAIYAHPGYLLYRRESALVAHAFDPAKLELKGDPIPIAEDVGFDATSYQGYFSHLSCASFARTHYQVVVKVHGVFPSRCGKPASSPVLQVRCASR